MLRRLTLLSVLVAFLAGVAHAHWADLAAAEIVLDPVRTELTLTVPTGLLGTADGDRDGVVSESELNRSRSELETRLASAVRLEDGRGRAAAFRLDGVAAVPAASLGIDPGSHSTLFLSYGWDAPPASVTLSYGLFLPEAPAASLIVTVARPDGGESFVLSPASPRLTLAAAQRSPWRQVRGFVALGVEHILLGYDHLLFLLALLAIGGGARQRVKLITAFTMAHSLTLALAVLDVVALPPRLVESVIALSIAYVAVENLLLGRSAERRARLLRWRGGLAFGFGLIHGLGFAGILAEIEIPAGSLVLSLASFNLGVELGQVAAVAVVGGLLLVVRRLTRSDAWLPGVRRWASLAAGLAGFVWFVERAFPFA